MKLVFILCAFVLYAAAQDESTGTIVLSFSVNNSYITSASAGTSIWRENKIVALNHYQMFWHKQMK